jgi:Aminoglycoside-2''-adenylyltransferase
LAGYPGAWALCGGWAVDAWLGDVTRDHLDVDITVFEDDQLAAYEHVSGRGWHLIAHDESVGGATREPWDGRPLVLPAHIHGARDLNVLKTWVPSGDPRPGELYLELMVNEQSGEDWVLNREPEVAWPIRDSQRVSSWGIPTVVPEVLLFYKATAYLDDATMASRNPKDAADFHALAARLGPAERAWLRDAIATVHPSHAWLPELSV